MEINSLKERYHIWQRTILAIIKHRFLSHSWLLPPVRYWSRLVIIIFIIAIIVIIAIISIISIVFIITIIKAKLGWIVGYCTVLHEHGNEQKSQKVAHQERHHCLFQDILNTKWQQVLYLACEDGVNLTTIFISRIGELTYGSSFASPIGFSYMHNC